MKYYPSLSKQLKNCSNDPYLDQMSSYAFKALSKNLEDDDCKRLIFDARQAKVFDESEEVDERRRDKIKPIFNFFYLELTDPILLKAQEPGCSDVFWSCLFKQNESTAIEVISDGKERRKVSVTKVTFFYKSKDDTDFIDRTWSLSPEGYPMVGRPPKAQTQRYVTKQGNISASGLVNPSLLPEYVKEGELVSVFSLENMDWWEKCIVDNTNLLYWMFAYMMAKSIDVSEIPLSRQVRRECERKGRKPNPWHIVKVQPKIKSGLVEVGKFGAGTKHSFRYDVAGHLRFGKHKTKDGSYKEIIEWVSNHQRGLDNDLYIPKTYKVESGNKVSEPAMSEYLGSDITKNLSK